MSFPLIFEETTSPLYASNDGKLKLDYYYEVKPQTRRVYQLFFTASKVPVLETYDRTLADAYIAGYDLGSDYS